ncbi:MAG: hypothetical protein JSR82_16240 [Verrucomicrobia bacterium]|nr:hypothetical protein [Verrucomicrobiota bacterium]
MNSALVFLATRSAWNAVLSRLRRLRQPKYLVGVIVGAGYFYWLFTGPMRGGDRFGRRPRLTDSMPTAVPDLDFLIQVAALLLLIFLLVGAWLLPSSRAALTFTESELAFLLPGPVSRQTLVRYKLLKSQLGLLLLAGLFTFLSGRQSRDGLALIHAAGWWLILATVQMHRLGASFTLTRLYDRGLSNARRRLAALGVLAGLIALLVLWRQAAPQAPAFEDLFLRGGFVKYLREVLSSGPAPWILFPFRLIVTPFFAPNATAFALAALPALTLLGAHYLWVTRADVAFEEASIAQSKVMAELAAARRDGQSRVRQPPTLARRAVFRLRSRGVPWVALMWKTLLQIGGRRAVWIATAVVGGLAGLGIVLAQTNLRPTILGMAVAFAAVGLITSFVFLPLVSGRSLQMEMAAGDAAKAWPLTGWQMVLGQLLLPALLAALLQTVCFGVLVAVASGQKFPRPDLLGLPFFAVPLLPALNLVLSLVPAAAPLLFPGWFRPGEQAGIEATGVRIISFFGQTLFSAAALVPVALAALATFLVASFALSAFWAGVVALAVAFVFLVVEALGGVFLLGGLVERYDPTES